MIQIDFPHLFLLFPILIGIGYLFDVRKLGNSFPNSIITKYCKREKGFIFLGIIRNIIILLCVSIVANISFSYHITKQVAEVKNIMIILDISRSMLAEDILPSRIHIAKQTINNFIHTRKGDNIGMIIFAGKPFTVIANSSDYKGISYFIESITPDFIFQEKPGLSGTNIGDALLLAEENLNSLSGKKSIILITDGSANIGSNPRESATQVGIKNIPIYTIGIGAKGGGPLTYTDIHGQKNYFYDENGEKITGDLDDELLQKIADITNGQYFSAENVQDLEKAFSLTSANIGNNISEKKIMQKVALTPIIICLLIIFLILEHFIRRKIYQHFSII